VLLQHPNDLLFREPRSLHLSVLQEGRTLNPRGGKSQRQVKPHLLVYFWVFKLGPKKLLYMSFIFYFGWHYW
jgi:hypothetical protein